jgi:hypothetical protein
METAFYALPSMLILFGTIYTLIVYFINRCMSSNKKRCTASCWAKLVGTEKVSHTREQRPYYTTNGVYELNLPDGSTVRVTSSVGYFGVEKDIGKQEKVYYNPENPKDFYVPSEEKRMDKLWKILYGVGILMIVVGFVIGIAITVLFYYGKEWFM